MVTGRTTRNRRTRGRLIRCHGCHFPIKWFRYGVRGGWRKYEPAPVDGRRHTGAPAHPVEGVRAWPVRDLIEDLMVRRRVGWTEAEDEVYAMPWHVPHVCPPAGATPITNFETRKDPHT